MKIEMKMLLRQARAILMATAIIGMAATNATAINIGSATDLAKIGNDPGYPLNGSYTQTATFSAGSQSPIGSSSSPFTGSYDGNGYEIQNLTISQASSDFVGLFSVATGATIQDVKLRNASITGRYNVGAIAGKAAAGATNCEFTGCQILGSSSVSGNANVGGMVGFFHGGLTSDSASVSDIDNCISYATVNESQFGFAGGLVGHLHIDSTVRNCTTYGAVNGNRVVGGFSGNIHGSVVENCDSYGNAVGEMIVGGFTGWVQEKGASSADTEVKNSNAHGNATAAKTSFSVFSAGDGSLLNSANGGFTGWIDGNAYIVDCDAHGNVSAPSTDLGQCGGFAGWIEEDALVEDSRAFGDVNHGPNDGGFIGWGEVNSEVRGCFAYGNVSGTLHVGGLMGSTNGKVIDCNAFGDVSSTSTTGFVATGGLVGYIFPTTVITDSGAFGDVSSNGPQTGGLVGFSVGGSSSAEISRCYAVGNVTSTSVHVGGLVGELRRGDVTDCFAIGDASGSSNVGGLIGNIVNSTGSVDNCYSTGSVSGSNKGGLIGIKHSGASVTDSFWDTQTSGMTTSAGGTGKTTAEMMTPTPFLNAGWSTSVWYLFVSNLYPHLK